MKQIGELELIEYIRGKFPQRRREILAGIGDDAMVFKNGLVVSTDSFVEGIHFDLKYFDYYQLGYRTMAGSVSDLAAMAAEPVCALVSLYLPRSVRKKDVGHLYRGFKSLADRFRFDISGGDIVESPYWGVTLTVIGYTRKPLLRSTARPGDGLYVTNYLGLAEAGRTVLQKGYPQNRFKCAVRRHLMPEPRVKEARLLARYASAGIDTSDGLSTDARHLADESGVKIIINAASLPIHRELRELLKYRRIDPVRFILSAGEDFEILYTARQVPELKSVKTFNIGRVYKGKGVWLESEGKITPIKPTGFEHLT
jgi:thiamine-monophosphate kinase